MEQRPADIQLWDNHDGTWLIRQQSPRAFATLKQEYGAVSFKIKDAEVFKIHLLCLNHDLQMEICSDIVLFTMTDENGSPIIDPKLPK